MKTTALFAIMLLFQMCSPGVMGLSTEGRIIKSEEDRVFVLFEEQIGDPGKFTGSWFYFPGLGVINERDYYIEVRLVKIDSPTVRPQAVTRFPTKTAKP